MLRCFNSPPAAGKPEGDDDDRNRDALRDLIIEELNSAADDSLPHSNSNNQCDMDDGHDSVQENEQPVALRDDVNNTRVDAYATHSDDVRIGGDTCIVVKESSL